MIVLDLQVSKFTAHPKETGNVKNELWAKMHHKNVGLESSRLFFL